METPQTVADTLEYEMGFDRGMEYAEKIARTAACNGSPMAHLYGGAAEILASRKAALLASATGMTGDERDWIG